MRSHFDVAVIGGGAAGVTAARRLHDSKIDCLLIEARPRLGGRAWTFTGPSGHPLDLGCGWLHSADRNPWVAVAQQQGLTIDKTPPPWMRPSLTFGFPHADQLEYIDAREAFDERIGAAEAMPDRPASEYLRPEDRWNALMNAVGTFVSGIELEHISAHDLARYDDTGVNWRVTEGLGTAVSAHAASVPVALECAVQRIDHNGRRLRLETSKGAITADRVIVALPTSILADGNLFVPALPDKTAAAQGLPLGFDDKLFLALDGASEYPRESRLYGRTDRAGTGAYHLRPFDRPVIECYFGGSLARELEAGDERAFFDFARSELVGLLGNGFARRIKFLAEHRWGTDPFARGAYSYALPGKADCRAALAQPVDQRLFFAGEACALSEFSTVHGAWVSGIAAADDVMAVRRRR